jgi:hypothetical protein
METMIGTETVGSSGSGRGRNRDRELLRYVGRFGLVRIGHVMEAMEAGRTVTYDRVASCVEAGLLERIELLRSEPGLLRATREGLRYAGLGLPVAVITPGAVNHWLRCASTAQHLAGGQPDAKIVTERQIVMAEQIEERPLASAQVGHLPNGNPKMHRADLLVGSDGRAVAVEVELTPKSPKRLQRIMFGWRMAECVDEVHYFCEPGQTRRAVERAVKNAGAQDKIAVAEAVPR